MLHTPGSWVQHRVQQPAGAQHSSLLPLAQAGPVGLTSSTDK